MNHEAGRKDPIPDLRGDWLQQGFAADKLEHKSEPISLGEADKESYTKMHAQAQKETKNFADGVEKNATRVASLRPMTMGDVGRE